MTNKKTARARATATARATARARATATADSSAALRNDNTKQQQILAFAGMTNNKINFRCRA
jgi:hypothetical protein